MVAWARLSSSQVNHRTLRESIDVNGWFCYLKPHSLKNRGLGFIQLVPVQSTSPVHQSTSPVHAVIVDGPAKPCTRTKTLSVCV